MTKQDGRCDRHPAYEADYCPGCGTAHVIGQQPVQLAPETLWIGPGGEVRCRAHAGAALGASIDAHPSSHIQTGLNGGDWLRATLADRVHFEASTGYVWACDICSPVMQRPKVNG